MTETVNSTAAKLIYVDDNESDRMIVEKYCSKHLGFKPECFNNGMPFFDYLSKFSEIEDLPRLILLDLNVPEMNGFDVIDVLKNHDIYKMIPVVVLSVSDKNEDILKCYRMNVNAYVCKNVDYDVYTKTLESTIGFWLDAAVTLT